MSAQRAHRQAGAYPRPPLPPDEPERLEALEQYDILDTDPEQAYDDLTLLASHICKAPIALVSLVDSDRQWFKSRVGLEASETHRDFAFCAHAIVAEGTMVVNDATRDERFARNPLVLGDPEIRFYAGAPLRVPGGRALGTLCVIDRVPRELTPEQQAALEALSRQVVAQLELRRRIRELQQYSARDPLTGVFNRGYFDTMLPVELERSKRYDDPTSLLLLDVDRFKQINDRI
jgi:GAF domain-containing protein